MFVMRADGADLVDTPVVRRWLPREKKAMALVASRGRSVVVEVLMERWLVPSLDIDLVKRDT